MLVKLADRQWLLGFYSSAILLWGMVFRERNHLYETGMGLNSGFKGWVLGEKFIKNW
jgi:hypothetical protein